MKLSFRFSKIAGVVCSLIAPGTGHFLSGMWVRGASWFGGVFLGGALIYYGWANAPIAFYSAFGLLMAVLATRDLLRSRERGLAKEEEPIVLKPEEPTAS